VSATRVAVLQGNIPAHDKFDRSKADRLAQRYIELGAEAARARPDLIVWTESAIPWPLREDDDLMNAMLRVTQPSGACHLLGATAAVGADGNLFANSALVVQPDGAITARYDKRHLVTFAEKPARLPLLSPFGLIHPENRAYTRGTGPPVLRTPVGRAGIMICNENLYPPLARACVRHGAEFLVQMANGAWIDAPAAVRQHFAVNTLRAVETGRDVVVANNAGVSALIDARGRVLARSPIGTAACLQGTIIRRTRPTLYARTGDAFAWLCLVAGAGSVWFAHRRERITATV
jgi:apolipoprotein N-acyltransferase